MQNPKNHFDFIIAGAGCAGLSLAWYLIKYTGHRYRILLLDSSFENQNLKTWCFWDTEFLPDPVPIYKSWEKISFSGEDISKTESLSETKYYCVRSSDYSNALIKNLKKHDNLTWIESEITAIKDHSSYGVVQTSEENYRAKYVFQSILNDKKVDNNQLKQHFLGWEITCNKPQFNSESVMLMDFNTDQKSATAFMYVLPYSDQNALFEYTLFSQNLLSRDLYEAEIVKYLNDRFRLNRDDYQICRVEKGVIPMTLNDQNLNKDSKHVHMIGQISGITKPTTGYTFNRIHRRNNQIALSISKNEHVPSDPAGQRRFRFYDLLLLHILKNNPGESLRIFSALFKKNSIESILRFLDEKTELSADLKLLTRLPFKPFIRSVYENRWQLFRNDY